ncbi:MAG: hypothetical protein KJ970_13830 [Candidatus Eisenbacteria bacterium]|uniref:Uncharacterized protein n=1 Tax=Eiseniibacteriota bacterium TaxID=2212470 RepID=A0A948RW80_UNCEI|nr:hypothetical protein [Candidatus Eisenbacteria bacterium]MBU1950042.1 hypothetical protein [Candidatus Eisenbacteria bacterium]MBU2691995.1 hypothetical protein [Candidatus Eisenbacteria bacterium]
MSGKARPETATALSAGPTLEFKVHFRNGDRGRRRLKRGARVSSTEANPGRIPRISRLMALALHFDDLIRKGVVKDYSDLARLGGVSRARISQIMDLLNLSPDIQEEILFLPRTTHRRDRVTERQIRNVVAEIGWESQWELWVKHRDKL